MEKFIIEYNMKNAPLALLWTYITTDTGLREWFADEVEIDGKDFKFYWNGALQTAKVVGSRNGIYIRFRWDDYPQSTFFEMKISKSELADHTTLTVTDFADSDDIDDTKSLWDSQVDALRRILGC